MVFYAKNRRYSARKYRRFRWNKNKCNQNQINRLPNVNSNIGSEVRKGEVKMKQNKKKIKREGKEKQGYSE